MGFRMRYDGEVVSTYKEAPKSAGVALSRSIKKWEFIVAWMEEHPGSSIGIPYDGGGGTCGLCVFYGDCEECPVTREDTDCANCDNTPYTDYRNAVQYNTALAAAKAEVEFLKSLKPLVGATG